ncbi:MAG: prepilin-type N-terminal cleavage/methylation domain-containing protein [Saccharospirillaceae bacterium]|nr:prepilin-type N-terminal cleavage/methylation domain-containing protein [Pseudomonadales bacterium]NRB81152.1 prepilin-type N-terminal cleavage/methylation domain-containing protein [Saccharospirillaceae bacterium]
MKQRGFTLIEILIALVLFAAIMVGAISLVQQGGQMRERFLINDKAIRQLQRATDKIQQDFRFFEPSRGIRNEYFEFSEPMFTDNNGSLIFTRNNWLLPQNTKNLRSNLQRISYHLLPSASDICQRISNTDEGLCLVRHHQYHLDQPSDSKIIKIPMLANLKNVSYEFFYKSKNSDESGSVDTLPLDIYRFPSAYVYAVEITFNSIRYGSFKKLIALPVQSNWVYADDN